MSRQHSATSDHLVRISLALILATALLTAAVEPAQAVASQRAMWVWSFSNASTTVKFARARGVTQLFVSVPANVTASGQLRRLRDLSSKARAAGIRVDALGGDPGWVNDPAWVVNNWLRPAIATGLFTGVHLDIEPYSGDPSAPWNTDRAGVVSRYLSTLDAMRSAAGAGTPIEADIPFWFNTIEAGEGSTLDREVIARTAGVTIMAYRSSAEGDDGTVALAAPEMAAAASLGKPARIGQETNYLGSDPVAVKQTFFGWTSTQMETQLSVVDQAYASSASYAGLAIHDYSGYSAMRQ